MLLFSLMNAGLVDVVSGLMRIPLTSVVFMIATVFSLSAAQPDRDWEALKEAARPPAMPKEWLETPPTAEQINDAMKSNAEKAARAAALAGRFARDHSGDERAKEAAEMERSLYKRAVHLGNWKAAPDWVEAEARGKGLDPSKAASFEHWVELLMGIVNSKEDYDEQTHAIAETSRILMSRFPRRDEVFALRTLVATRSEPDEARRWAKALIEDKPPAEFVEVAESLLKRLSFIGKTWDLKFTDMDGRKVDLRDYRGKVVLVTFWATWCGPCMKEMPRLMQIRDEYRDRGYEMIGISFDTDEARMRRTVKERGMKFPQFFDGKSWNEGKGDKYGIITIPAEWLVDKNGVIRDINAREKLEEKIETLLGE